MLLAAAWVFSAVIYIGFAGQISTEEVALAVGCGLAAAIWIAALRHVAALHFQFERPAFGALSRALISLPRAVARVAGALASGHRGEIVRHVFVRGRDLDPADAARRAVAVLAISLTPDRFVLRIEPARDEIDLHTLPPTSTAVDIRWPA